jgi:biopolymer transport protein ExbD
MPVCIRKNRSEGALSLSLTPLIDCVFLLLIFFLVATRFEQEERDMDVDLPKASEAEPTIAKGKEIFVTVTPEGEFFLDGSKIGIEQLETQLTAAYHNNPGRQKVTIRADRDSRTGHVVLVMNACQKANIRDYSIATE